MINIVILVRTYCKFTYEKYSCHDKKSFKLCKEKGAESLVIAWSKKF